MTSATATDVAGRVYERWNAGGLAALTDTVDPAVELVCDPLRPVESTLRGIDGWKQWAARWHESYASLHITIDGLIPMSPDHVLALVSMNARPRDDAGRELAWAAAHLWTVREGRIARWESHVDIELARNTLL